MQIGPYVVEGELGRGGFGVVFRARSASGEVVAIKVLLDADAERLARFERERKLVGAFTARDGFVPLLDAGEVSGRPYLVMPLVPGGTLRDRLKRGRLEVGESVALARALARALAGAHERGVVHRDLKPENVLFDGEGKPLIADLGLAKALSETGSGRSLSRTGQGAGTPGYMAPEQIDDSKRVGPAADVFALGAILYECLAGRPAIDAASPLARLSLTAQAKVKPIQEQRPEVPDALAALVHRALADAAEKRFRDAGELANALAATSGERRSSLRVAAIVAVLVLALAAVAVAFALRRRGSRPGPPASVSPESAETLHARARAKLAANDAAGALPDLEKVVALSPQSAAAWTDLGVARNWLGDHAGAIAAHSKAIERVPSFALAWSNRAVAKAAIGDRQGAVADAERVTGLTPNSAEAWDRLGYQRARAGDQRGAIVDFTHAMELDPRFLQAWLDRAESRVAIEDFPAASKDYSRAIELRPTDARLYEQRGQVRLKIKDGARDAEADFTKAIELDPKRPELLLLRFNARKELGDAEGAVADLEQFVKLAPDHPQAEKAREKIRAYNAAR